MGDSGLIRHGRVPLENAHLFLSGQSRSHRIPQVHHPTSLTVRDLPVFRKTSFLVEISMKNFPLFVGEHQIFY